MNFNTWCLTENKKCVLKNINDCNEDDIETYLTKIDCQRAKIELFDEFKFCFFIGKELLY